MEQKHFMDIQHIREEDTELRERNTKAFYPGCVIQISEKYDGCLFGTTPITLSDGTTKQIRDIVDNNLDVEVLTYNFETNQIESSKILHRYNHGKKKPFISVYYKNTKKHASSPARITCTADHLFYTSNGYVEAGKLKEGDVLYTHQKFLNNVQKQLILGTMLGDSAAYPIIKGFTKEKFPNRNHGIIFSHTEKQYDYLYLKKDVLGSFVNNVMDINPSIDSYSDNHKKQCRTRCDYQIEELLKLCTDDTFKKKISTKWLYKLDVIGLAFWYMDDGSLNSGPTTPRATLHTEGYSKEENIIIKDFLKSKFDIDCAIRQSKGKYYFIDINTESSDKFFSIISPFVPISMQYKLPDKYKLGEFNYWTTYFERNKMDDVLEEKVVIAISDKVETRACSKNNYDIETENHNYFANGILVHNSNFSVAWDEETQGLKCFSRKKELDFQNTLNGFWNFVQAFPENVVNEFRKHPNWRVFGEANCKNKIIYNDTGKVKHWYVYDIYDVNSQRYLMQGVVKQFCIDAGLEYIHELYYGPFISWEHCRSFMNRPAYGDKQEGIIIKQQGEWDENDRNPHVLKIVNEDFRESMKTKEKIVDPEVEAIKEEARNIMESIVAPRRVEKILFKLRDEGILPEKIQPTDFKIVARNLPKAVWEDIMKEEKELVMQCGEYGGKLCQQISMSIARDILLGT